MAEKRRLTPDEWAQVRRRWEGDPRDGFAWLAAEIEAAWGVPITRPAVRQMATKPGAEWAKGPEEECPLPVVVGAKVSPAKPAKDGKKEAAKVSAKQPPAAPRPTTTAMVPAAAGAVNLPGRIENEETGLTAANERYAFLLAQGKTQTEAFLEAFPQAQSWKREVVYSKASTLAADGKVRARVQALMAAAAEANAVQGGFLLSRYMAQATADPRELSEIRVAPCRYCHGQDHLYQYTDGELAKRKAEHEQRRQERLDDGKRDIGEFNEQGGGGFNISGIPNPECPSCGGEGEPRVVLKDSRTYTQGGLSLFLSAKQGKEGIEVKVRDGNEALQQIARHKGFFEADKDPAPVFQAINYVELGEMYDRLMAESAARDAEAKGRMDRLRARGVVVDT
jgi:hypothetical protein